MKVFTDLRLITCILLGLCIAAIGLAQSPSPDSQPTGSLDRLSSDSGIQKPTSPAKEQAPVETINLSEAEWRKRLTPLQFRILRRKGTERAFTGPLLKNKASGTYHCAGCNAPLFESKTKFRSGTGWPSFYDSLPGQVRRVDDHSHGMTRTEIVCARCGGHLGHVFRDGPQPTGDRHCVNSAALKFKPSKHLSK